MKCIKSIKSGMIKRVSDENAEILTQTDWEYTSKSEWKSYKNGESLKEQEVIGKAGDVGMGLQNPLTANKQSKSSKRNAKKLHGK
jgi:hypothetical protein